MDFLLNDIWTFGRTRLMSSSSSTSKTDSEPRTGSLH